MKRILNWFVLTMLMVAFLPITSCSNDDDPTFPTVQKSSLAGTWDQGETYKTIEKADVDLTAGLPTFKSITFDQNGSLTATTAEGEVSGTYTLSGDEIKINAGDLNKTFKIKFRGFDTNTICLTYSTTGILGATEETEGEKVDVDVTIHYSRNISTEE